MTDREKAIVMAYTGICMLTGDKLGEYYSYLEELYGRPVYTHEWSFLDIREKSKKDFLKLCENTSDPVKHGHWVWKETKCVVSEKEIVEEIYEILCCSICDFKLKNDKSLRPNFCPNCGTKMDEERKEE